MYLECQGFEYPPIHDPCAVFAVLERDNFKILPSKVTIECSSK